MARARLLPALLAALVVQNSRPIELRAAAAGGLGGVFALLYGIGSPLPFPEARGANIPGNESRYHPGE